MYQLLTTVFNCMKQLNCTYNVLRRWEIRCFTQCMQTYINIAITPHIIICMAWIEVIGEETVLKLCESACITNTTNDTDIHAWEYLSVVHCIGPWLNSYLSISEIMSIKLTFDYWSLRLDSHVTYMYKHVHMVALQKFPKYAKKIFVVVMSCKCVKKKSKSLLVPPVAKKIPLRVSQVLGFLLYTELPAASNFFFNLHFHVP